MENMMRIENDGATILCPQSNKIRFNTNKEATMLARLHGSKCTLLEPISVYQKKFLLQNILASVQERNI